MAQRIAIVRRDLDLKHRRMAESAFVFLRGTFYRWVQLWPEICPELAGAPQVPSVGDLHVENFGTWRDEEGRLVWGVNDVDEACVLPYANDLVRLAASATLAARHGHLHLTARDAAAAILGGYAASLERGGRPIVLAEKRRWLRRIALGRLRDPSRYWPRLEALPPAGPRAAPLAALRAALPDPRMKFRLLRRAAGVGSLGRPRFVAIGEHRGALVAREAKAVLPPAAAWANGREAAGIDAATLLARAVRSPDPFFQVADRWIVRRLAPDCSRIELEELPRERDEHRLLRAMGWETANIHLGRPRARILADLASRPRRWLAAAATAMADAIEDEWRNWSRAR